MNINKLKNIFTIRETLIIICGILVHLYFSPAFNYYDHHKKIITIEEGMSKVAKTCGEGYFVSWLSMDIKGLKDQGYTIKAEKGNVVELTPSNLWHENKLNKKLLYSYEDK